MSPLVGAEELAARLGEPGLVVLEVSLDPSDAAFREAHVPGSRWAWWKALLWHETDRRFPEPGILAARLGALGVSDGDTLVLVGDPIQFGTYAYWVLHLLGRHDVAVLDGGRARWTAGGFPVETGGARPASRAAHAAGEADFSAVVGRDGVLAALGGEPVILDFRTPEEYAGERVSPASAPIDHGAERKGRIPGARHLYYERLLAADGTFRPVDELASVFAEAGVGPDDEVMAYCRLSHRASLGWFVLTRLLGRERVRVYDGSWTEWGSMVGMPVESGKADR
ncbi:MAG TPA: sulfurtransferase [Gaiellaceae bacterium]|nr:sulfurtransferase [Gaiellaceae bacterium]